MTPKVSIGMPVYNGQPFIQEALEAILNQTWSDFELIISDNCSTDQTQAICQSYADKDPRIRYVRQPKNLGATGNFNALVHLARGQYFKWAACDDLMEPTFVQRCVETLERDEAAAWCHSKSDMIDGNGRSFREILTDEDEELELDSDGNLSWIGHPRKHYNSSDPIARYRGVVLGTNWCVDVYGLFRLEILKQTRLLLPYYGTEKVLLGEVALLGRFAEIPEILFAQRIHDRASSNIADHSAQEDFIQAQSKPATKVPPRLMILRSHLGAIRHSQLTVFQKLRAYLVAVHYVFQVRKWRRVLSKMFEGTGLGGGGRRMLQSAKLTDGSSVARRSSKSKQPTP